MSGQKLFQKTVLAGVMACALGLGACTMMNDDEWLSEEEEFALVEADGADGEAALLEEDIIPCHPDDEGCAVSDDYLTGTFIQTELRTEDKGMPAEEPLFDEVMSDDVIALSRPAGANAVAVKDKERPAVQSTSDKVLYSTRAIPETTQKTVQVSSGARTAVTATAPAAAAVVVKETSKETDTVEEVGSSVEMEQDLQTAISVPGQMMPLKKVTTTITETTTKVKQEPKAYSEKGYDFRKMTLKEKVAYGESDQEWQANAGNTLRGLLMEWGNRSGWTVVWKLDRDYRLEAGVIFQGTFTDVSSALIRSFARATPAPIGTFYQGNRVLVISTQEDENER